MGDPRSTDRAYPEPQCRSAVQRCVGDPRAFERAWGSDALVTARVDPDGFADILGLADVDRIVSMAARRPTIRLVADGTPLEPARYCTALRLGGQVVDDVADPRKVADRVRDGATLVLQSLHRTWPNVAALVDELHRELGHPVQANAYLTPPGAVGLAPHRDAHDVIVLQLHGSKCWTVEGLGEVELQAGDSMYVPARTLHSAATTGSASLHLTLGVIPVTYRDVLRRILDDGPDLLDAPLPIGYRHRRDDALRTGIEACIDEVRARLAGVDPDERARRERTRRGAGRVPHGHLASLLRRHELDADDEIRWVAPAPLVRPTGTHGADAWRRLDDIRDDTGTPPVARNGAGSGPRVDVHLGDRLLTVPSVVVDALRILQPGAPVRVGDLPGLDPPSRVVLARRLVAESACVIAVTDTSTAPHVEPTNASDPPAPTPRPREIHHVR